MKKILFFISGLSLMILASCGITNTIKGNGNIVTEDRNVSNFKSIDVSGGIEIIYTQNDKTDVSITTDENLQDYIETSVNNETLYISQKSHTGINSTKGVKVAIAAPSLKDITVSGACKFVTANPFTTNEKFSMDISGAGKCEMNITAPAMYIGISGAGKGEFSGNVKNVKYDLSGAAKIDAYQLVADSVDVEASGAAKVEVFANNYIKLDASGAAALRYKGNAKVEKDVSGAVSVSKED